MSAAASRPELKTDRLLVRPPKLSDTARIQLLAGDWEVARTTAVIPHPYADGMAEAFIAHSDQCRTDDSAHIFAIVLSSESALIGMIDLRLDADRRQAETGYWIGRPYWGRGYATEALGRLMRYAFDEIDLATLTAYPLAENAASIRVLEKAGFVRSGRTRRSFLHLGTRATDVFEARGDAVRADEGSQGVRDD